MCFNFPIIGKIPQSTVALTPTNVHTSQKQYMLLILFNVKTHGTNWILTLHMLFLYIAFFLKTNCSSIHEKD